MNEWTLFQILLIVFFGLAVAAFAAIRFIPVPYGRHNRRGWGLQVRAYLGWMLMESPSFFVFAFFFLLEAGSAGAVGVVFLVLWEVHYIQRSFVYPFLIRNRQTRMPLVIILMAMTFTTWNSYLNSRYLFHFSGGYSSEWLTDPRFLLGVMLFVSGLAINWHSDRILRRLRQPGEKTYLIPRGADFSATFPARTISERRSSGRDGRWRLGRYPGWLSPSGRWPTSVRAPGAITSGICVIFPIILRTERLTSLSWFEGAC